MLCNRTENGDSEPGKIGNGIRQGCLLSPFYSWLMQKWWWLREVRC